MIDKDAMVQGQCIFALHFPIYMQWSNMRQTSGVSQNFTETMGFGTIFSAGNDFPCTILILITKFLRYCRKEIDLEYGINGTNGLMPDSRSAIPDGQLNERNPRICRHKTLIEKGLN